jgi:hypothetical protein|tara:strand:- start:140 stop:358 length:219 start_codon:yes stop_codon:yes gene_type:complete
VQPWGLAEAPLKSPTWLPPTTQVREQRNAKVVRLKAPSREAAAAHGSPLGVTFFPSDSHQGGYVSLLRKRSE